MGAGGGMTEFYRWKQCGWVWKEGKLEWKVGYTDEFPPEPRDPEIEKYLNTNIFTDGTKGET